MSRLLLGALVLVLFMEPYAAAPKTCKPSPGLRDIIKRANPPLHRLLLDKRGRNGLKKLPGQWIAELREYRPPTNGPPPVYNFTSCAVVGNGGVMQSQKFGAAIDSHTAVFRINQAPTKGYHANVGRRTTFRVLNKMWTRRYANPRSWMPKDPGTTFLLARGDGEKEIFFTYYYNTPLSWRIYLAKMSGDVAASVREVFTSYLEWWTCTHKRAHAGGDTPTTGLYTVITALAVCGKTTIYGFGNGGTGRYQYYELEGSERTVGKDLHSFDLERDLLRQLHNEGMLELCTEESAAVCGKQSGKPGKPHRLGPKARVM